MQLRRGRRQDQPEPARSALGDQDQDQLSDAAIVVSFYESFEQRDLEAISSLLHPGIEVWQSETLPWGGSYSGIDQFQDFALKLSRHIRVRVVVEDAFRSGGRAVVCGRTVGHTVTTRIPIDVPVVHLWSLETNGNGDRLKRLEAHMDTAAMLEILSGESQSLADLRSGDG